MLIPVALAQGDLEDRTKIRRAEADKKRAQQIEAAADELMVEAENLANMGLRFASHSFLTLYFRACVS